MDDLVKKILEIIKGYRNGDIEMITSPMNEDHIHCWIEQFDEDDQEFILSELLHLLPNSYLTKETTLEIFSTEFEILSKDFGYENVNDFLDESIFLDCQKDGKSQKILLKLINDLLSDKYNYKISECGTKKVKHWIYTDDVLASGGTFRNDILEEIESYGTNEFVESDIRIISSFFILHTWGSKNVRFALDKKLDFELKDRLKFYRVAEIDNNPYIHPYYNPIPKFNFVYPIESEEGNFFLDFIENAFERTYEMKNKKFAFRNPDYPKKEELFSSAENRERYEQILLSKGIEIINSIDNLRAQSLRPLGMTPPAFKTLGTGSHFFTWRNISNTCPIVYWWGTNNWHPLFPVTNRGNH
ncbi:MAG: hypothetical protein GQ564_13125 [Bacteroidales bacterium]|nr:hypothetical protein [Bacteroidales bacterium]